MSTVTTTIEYRLTERGTDKVLITFERESAAVRAWLQYSESARERIRVMRAIIETEVVTTMSYLEWSKVYVR